MYISELSYSLSQTEEVLNYFDVFQSVIFSHTGLIHLNFLFDLQQEDSDEEDDLDDDALSDWNLSKLSSLYFYWIAGVIHFCCSLLCRKQCYKVANVAIQFRG